MILFVYLRNKKAASPTAVKYDIFFNITVY